VASAAAHVHYEPPSDAPVVDPFRPPPGPYAAGNRGIEYRTVPGSAVRAAADGRVTFAGAIAGSLYVTLIHADGIRTSYSYLASIAVTPGEEVRLGQPVGTAGSRLHVGARRGDTYIDPARLWARGPPRVHLVPLDGGPPEVTTQPRSVPPPFVGAARAARAAHGWRRFARWLA
jgi:murein DD-endopeptidase MepM/ murein hydrolase activator NlpD